MRETRLMAFFAAFFVAFSVQAQDFRVQIGAFSDSLPSSYFAARGIVGAYYKIDQHGLYRYFTTSFSTRDEAEQLKNALVQRGYPNASVLDMEEQRALCGVPCPYRDVRVFAKDSLEKYSVHIVYFDFNQTSVDAEGEKELQKIFRKMKARPSSRLSITGHADAVGSAQSNVQISLHRARNVRNVLVNKGIHSDRIKVKVFGEAAPVGQNSFDDGKDAVEGRRFNRRVVIVITDESGEVSEIQKELEKGIVPVDVRFDRD